MESFLKEYEAIILPLHLLSAIVWIGGMIMFIFAVYPSLKQIPNEKSMTRTALRTFRRYFNFLFFFIIISMITGVVMEMGGGYESRSPTLGAIVSTKEAIWVLMFLNFLFSYFKIIEAKNKCLNSDVDAAKDNIRLITYYLFGINIFLGIVALYFGLILQGA